MSSGIKLLNHQFPAEREFKIDYVRLWVDLLSTLQPRSHKCNVAKLSLLDHYRNGRYSEDLNTYIDSDPNF